MDPLRFHTQALQYLEYEYKTEVLPMGPYFHVDDKLFYLNHARLWKVQPSYVGDHITPLLISPEKVFV